jgi:tetratricopeptide (TPR) repeat protein
MSDIILTPEQEAEAQRLATLLDLARPEEALGHLLTSLENSTPQSSIIRKLYHLIVLAHRQLGQMQQAQAVCKEGLSRFPDDGELLLEQGLLSRDCKDPAGAEESWQRLLHSRKGNYFASEDVGLRGYRTRQLLAELCLQQNRTLEAEVLWRAALAERADFEPSWLGLAEVYLRKARWPELEDLLQHLTQQGAPRAKLGWLRARGQVLRKDFAAARRTLEEVNTLDPLAMGPRVLLSQALLQEGRDWIAAEQALCDVLGLDPQHAESRHNLALLLQQQHPGGNSSASLLNLADAYRSAFSAANGMRLHLPMLYFLARQCRHITELGPAGGVSTTAWLFARPRRLVCYASASSTPVSDLQRLAVGTDLAFHPLNGAPVQIEDTDLLYIASPQHLAMQLPENAAKVRKYLVLNTSDLAGRDQDQGYDDLRPTLERLVADGSFRTRPAYPIGNRLAILERNREALHCG